MPVTIRFAGAGDIPAIVRVHVSADRETYRPLFGARFQEVSPAESRARWEGALGRGGVIVVAEEEDGLVGFGCAAGDWLEALYLLPTHQRRGLGGALLARLCETLAARGVAEVGLQAVAGNAGAIAFYERLGARVVGQVIEVEGDDAWEDVVMRLPTEGPVAFLAAQGRCKSARCQG